MIWDMYTFHSPFAFWYFLYILAPDFLSFSRRAGEIHLRNPDAHFLGSAKAGQGWEWEISIDIVCLVI